MDLVDDDKYSLNNALCDNKDIYKYEGSPTKICSRQWRMHRDLSGTGKMVHKAKKRKNIYWQRGRWLQNLRITNNV